MIRQVDVRYRDDNPAAYDCFRHSHVGKQYTLSVFTDKETGFPTLGDSGQDMEENVDIFDNVMKEHALLFADETGMDVSYNSKNNRFELSGLDFKYSFENQEEAEEHASKVHRFDAECGAVLADFRQQIHELSDPEPETHLRDRVGFYCARGIKDRGVFDDFVYKTAGSNEDKAAAMRSVADRFHEQHPDYRMGVYFTPCDSVCMFPADYDGRPESLKTVERPTKKFLQGLSSDEREAHIKLLKDFDLASDDFIYAAASGIDRGLCDDFTKAVDNLNDNNQESDIKR